MIMFGRAKAPQPSATLVADGAPKDRAALLAALATEEAASIARQDHLADQVDAARAREASAREELATASANRAAVEAEQFAASPSSEYRIAGLRRQLAEGAPRELDMFRENIRTLAAHARTKGETRLVDGFQGLDGRRTQLVDTNVAAVADVLALARRLDEALTAEAYVEAPDVERFGPFSTVSIPASQLERALRQGDAAAWVSEDLGVPVALAVAFAAVGGVASPRSELSPAQLREMGWAAEQSLRRRWHSEESWR